MEAFAIWTTYCPVRQSKIKNKTKTEQKQTAAAKEKKQVKNVTDTIGIHSWTKKHKHDRCSSH